MRLASVLALTAIAILLVARAPGAAEAATITINTTADVVANDGLCSLREAITAANTDTESGVAVGECAPGSGADTITVPTGTYTLGSQLIISTDVTLNGEGAPTTIIQAAATPGSATYRVLSITGGTVAISGVTIRHGNLTDHGGGVLNAGTLSVTDSTFSDNDASNTRHGGAINNQSGATLSVLRSTFSGNSASEGGAVQNRGTAIITNSTFSGNSANSGGGLDNIGSGVTATVVNSTFTGNSAGSGGGIYNIFGTVTIANTISVGNSGSPAREDCFNGGGAGASFASLGHNLVGIGTGCPNSGTGDLTTADAKLGPLQDNGGPTFTHELLSSSPAIDAGNPAIPGSGGNACAATDQRGVSRPQGARCDIGAFEAMPAAAVPGLTPWALIALAMVLAVLFYWRLGRPLLGVSRFLGPTLLGLSAVFLSEAAPAQAQQAQLIVWEESQGGNGHSYALTSGPLDWFEAQSEAEAFGGYLVSINSQSEQEFIVQSFLSGPNSNATYWIGLTDKDSEGVFKWVNGEPVTYTNWYPGEPNEFTAGEDFVIINWHFTQGQTATPGDWNDVPQGNGVGIIEMPEPTSVPGPAGFGLIILMLLLAALVSTRLGRGRSGERA